jgi:hydroxymethylpyrimidine/phosphomethylpyrimidine kinase
LPAYRRALTIAGSDSGGGAGIQADLKSFAALGCFGLSAVTAVTAQNTLGVQSVHALPAAMVAAQIDSVASDMGVDAVKIGMLANAEIVVAVADRIRRHGLAPVVLDPVMIATGGAPLLDAEGVAALAAQLMPLASLVTPNLPEAEALLGHTLASRPAIEQGARDLLAGGAGAVLIKGGHAAGVLAEDCLVWQGGARVRWLSAARIPTANSHGTGCTLSAAIAAGLAQGKDVESAVTAAKDYVTAALAAGADYRLGRGAGPLHHLFALWR